MTADEVRVLADTTLRPVLGDRNVEQIVVREQDDWTGDPALYIDVFVDPALDALDAGQWLNARLRLSDQLIERGETRFPFFSLTDREEQASAEAERQKFE